MFLTGNLTYFMQFEMWLGFDQNPIYDLLHESIYYEVTTKPVALFSWYSGHYSAVHRLVFFMDAGFFIKTVSR